MRWLTAHWELKLVAGVLAVALWVYTSGQVRVERTVTITAGDAPVKGLPSDYQAVQIRPREFKVRLSIPLSRQAETELDTLVPRLEVRPDQLGGGVVSFPLTSALLRLPNDVRIEATEPENVRELEVVLDRIAEGLLPVDPPRLSGLPEGLEASATVDASLVRVQAATTVLERLRSESYRVRFQDIPLGHLPATLEGPRTEHCVLVPLVPPMESPYRLLQPLSADIVIRPTAGEQRTVTLPLTLAATSELWKSTGIEPAQTRITTVIRGPVNLLKDLQPERDLTAVVLLRDDLPTNGIQQLPVRILGPAWLVADPVTAAVALSRGTPR